MYVDVIIYSHPILNFIYTVQIDDENNLFENIYTGAVRSFRSILKYIYLLHIYVCILEDIVYRCL